MLRSAYGIAQKAGAVEAEAKVAEALSELGLATDEADRLMPLYLHVLGLGDPNAALRHVEPEQPAGRYSSRSAPSSNAAWHCRHC